MPCDSGDLWVDHRLHLNCLAALHHQCQSGIRGQLQLAGFHELTSRHVRFGESEIP